MKIEGRGFAVRTFRCFVLISLLSVAFLPAIAHAQAQKVAVTFRHGELSVDLHYHSPNRGAGKLVIEILDPEDHSLGGIERAVAITKEDGMWEDTIHPEKPLVFEDMLWQRLRYRFEFDEGGLPAIEGIESISQILRRPVVHVLGQSEYIAGSRAAIRVIVSDTESSSPLTGTVRIELIAPNETPALLFSGTLNRRGTIEAGFKFPAGLIGKDELRFVADTPIGSTEFTQPVHLQDKASILLTTEKPIYQPGQTMHVRALALDRASHRADAARSLRFELEDSHGNKVFRKSTETDRFGIASADFTLADEVNLGAYHLRALMGDPESPANTAEITLQVERYVLPKFKVAIDFSQKDSKPRRDYRPGDHVTGTVRANYFFGKPVDHADVTIKASSADVAVFEAASASGKTDGDGAYHFDLKLPSYFAGRPLSQGAGRALIEATVKDSADHGETRGEPITISESPLLITAIPEGGTLIPNIENEIFILSSYPDGSPAPTTLSVHVPSVPGHHGVRDQQLTADASGVAVFQLNPGAGIETLSIQADDHHGNRTLTTVALQTREGTDQILLRADQAIFKAGDRIQLKVLSTRTRGTAYVDIVRNGQTILTRDLDLQGGQAELALTATPEMAGTLDIDAYLFGRDAQPVADHRLVFVQPADDLKIQATSNSAVYLPGSEASIKLHVTNSRGEGVQAALGLQLVDEAVFALAEKEPGFAKVFFYLEQELMKPRYEIHSLSMGSVVEDDNPGHGESQDLAARALFSASELAMPAKLDVEFGRSFPQQKFAEYQERYHAAFKVEVQRLAAKLSQQISDHPTEIVKTFEILESGAPPRDLWNTSLQIEPTGWNQGRNRFFLVRSAGPDRKFGTGDDMAVYIEERTGNVVNRPGRDGTFDLRIEHDRGPFNGRAEITGTVSDASGAVVAGATITLDQISNLTVRTTHAGPSGQFTFAGVPPGRYKIRISSLGFQVLSGDLTLEPRDLATVWTVVSVGAVTEAVMVEAEDMPVNREFGAATGMNAAGLQAAPRAQLAFKARAMIDDKDELESRSFAVLRAPATPDAPHVRSYFPEALYVNPEIVTDGNGDANISIPIADSITTWRIAMLASTKSGALGSGTSSLKVFQDFFVDLDLPVTLTQGDRVSIPVALYNYAGQAGQVTATLKQEDWFSLDDDVAEKTVRVESGRVASSQFTIDAKRIGKFKLTLSAHMAGAESRDDIVVREIEVVPNGREQNLVFNGRLENSAQHDLKFPADSIPDATSIVVRLYPGPLSQVIEGMDSILQMPGGCFEQTSSSTYPNVLALDYMKRTKKLTPETHAKAEGYIANGYQRLLTFEVPGGGFSWFGQAPANKILTAYGLMEFNDMSKVSDVDPRLIERTGNWLASQQQPDGSWKPDTYFINEGATNRFNSDHLRITAYIAWALANTGYQGDAIEKARRYIEKANDSVPDAYTLAVIANFAADYGKDRDFIRRSMQALLDAKAENGDQVSWTSEETGVYSTGQSASIETTGLAVQALLKWGQASETTRKALNFIAARKDAAGNWGTTQATIMALRALLMATQFSASNVRGSLEVMLNDETVETLKLTQENNDLLHQFVLKGIDPQKANSVQLKFDGSGSLAYQVVGRYFTPWNEKAMAEPLTIGVAFDRTHLVQNDVVTATATVRNNLPKFANMVMVDLGIPPGFDLLSEDLQTIQEKTAGDDSGRLEKFSLTATQAILYFNRLSPKQTVTLKFRLRAKYPIRARTFESRVYEYYDPQVSATAQPKQLEVTAR
jgi:hypothetical protein